MSWDSVDKPTTVWTLVAKPSRGTAPDGFMYSGTSDGFEARPHTDGFFAPDGTWTPVIVKNVVWALVAKPT